MCMYIFIKVKVLVAQSRPTLCDPMDFRLPGKNTGVGCHSLLQGIFLTQGLNPGFLHCRLILYHLSQWGRNKNQTGHQGKLWIGDGVECNFRNED